MGIKEETVNLNFNWSTYSKKTKAIFIGCVIFCFSLIRFSFNTQYIGFFAGECSGVCNSIYTITANKVIIENIDNISGKATRKVLTGEFDNLKFNTPLFLLSNITGNFGCPDCNDGGGYVIGFKFFWVNFKFSLDKDSSPWYFSNATDIIRDRLGKLRALESAQSKP